MAELSDCDVVILCGGKGTRLLSVVSDRPKSLADVSGRPFMDHLLGFLRKMGLKRFILAVGHMKEHMEEKFSGQADTVLSVEEEPLGTGGAVRNAVSKIQSEHFLVMNGDTFINFDHREIFNFHLSKNADATILVSAAPSDRVDVGNIRIGSDERVVSYREKAIEAGVDRFMSCGIYYMKKDLLKMMPREAFSLETYFFPRLTSGARFYAYKTHAQMLDIGTPERYASAADFLGREMI